MTVASADTIWNINASFVRSPGDTTDVSTVVGSFTVNTALTGLVSWNIQVTGFGLLAPATFDYKGSGGSATNGIVYPFSTTELIFADSNADNEALILDFQSALTNATNGTKDFLNTSVSDDCGGCGFAVTGTVVTAGPASTPEPTSLMLLGSGLLGLVGFGRRKLRA